MVSRNWHRRMLFVRERFLEKHLRMNLSLRRLTAHLNAVLNALRMGDQKYIQLFQENCAQHESLSKDKHAQECSVCELKVFKGCIIVCRACNHGGHKEHIREWFKNNPYCPQCMTCPCFKF